MSRKSFFFLIFVSIAFIYCYTCTISSSIFTSFQTVYAFYPTTSKSTINHQPIAQNISITIADNSPIVIGLKGKDPDRDKIYFVPISKPVYGKINFFFDNSTGLITYIPSSLNDVFTFKIYDNRTAESNIGIVTIKFPK